MQKYFLKYDFINTWNIRYDQNYRMVFVSSLDRINEFLESRYDILSEDMVEKIIRDLKYYVTK